MFKLCLILSAFYSMVVSAQQVDFQVEVNAKTTDAVYGLEGTIVAITAKNGLRYQPLNQKIRQINQQFSPFITIAQPRTMVELPNEDNTAHHVYSFSQAMTFELPLYNKTEQRRLEIERQGIIVLGCNIHDWMLGFIVVVDTPYVNFLNDNKIAFENVAEGEYELAIWHPSMDDFWVRQVLVSAQNNSYIATLPFEISPVIPLPTPGSDDLDDY